jgi:hypothetical protein
LRRRGADRRRVREGVHDPDDHHPDQDPGRVAEHGEQQLPEAEVPQVSADRPLFVVDRPQREQRGDQQQGVEDAGEPDEGGFLNGNSGARSASSFEVRLSGKHRSSR